MDDTIQNSLSHPSEPSALRTQVFRTLHEKGFGAISQKYGGQNIKGWIKEKVRQVLY